MATELRPVASLAGDLPGDVESAHKGHAHAVERIRGLEQQLASAFEKLHCARQELKDRAGVDALTHFDEPVGAAWKVWLAARETEGMAVAPRSDEEMRREREDAALELVQKASGVGTPVPVGGWDPS